MGDEGLETSPENAGKTASPVRCGAESGAVGADFGSVDPNSDRFDDDDLRVVIEHWPALPEAIKASILAMVRKAGDGGGLIDDCNG